MCDSSEGSLFASPIFQHVSMGSLYVKTVVIFHATIGTDSPPEGPISCHVSRALSALTTAAYSLQWAALRSTALQLPRVVRCAAAALTRACHRGYKYLAHGLLSALATELVLEDGKKDFYILFFLIDL